MTRKEALDAYKAALVDYDKTCNACEKAFTALDDARRAKRSASSVLDTARQQLDAVLAKEGAG